MSIYSLAPFITSLFVLSLGFFVLSKNNKRSLNRIFFYICLTSCVWLFAYSFGYGYENENMALVWLKIGYSGIVFIPMTTFHYTIEFLNLRKLKLAVVLNYLLGIVYLILIWSSSILIKGPSHFFWGYYPQAGDVHPVFLIHFLSLIGFSFSLWIYFYFYKKDAFTHLQIMQIRYIFIAFVIYNFASIDFFPNYGINIYPFGFLPSLIFTLIVGYTIARYRLMDVHLVIRKSMVYSLSAGILTSLFVVIVISMTKFLSNKAGITSFAVTVIAALIIAFLFNPLKNKIQLIIDRKFYKKNYDYYPTIRKISRDLVSIFDLDDLYKYVGKAVLSTLGLKNIYIMHAVPGSGYEIIYFQSHKQDDDEKRGKGTDESDKGKKIQMNSELVKFYSKSDDILIKDELPGLEKNLGQERTQHMKYDIELFRGEAVVPVFNDRHLVLLIILGEKLSGDMFANDDINLLGIVANQLAVSMKNAHLYKDKVYSERLASIGMMSATFAHEVRNPLTSLKTFAQLMPEKYNDQEFRDVFSKIVVGEIERIDGLIRDLLDFSTEKKSSRSNNYNLVSIVDETVEYVKGKLDFEKKKINIEKNYGNNVIDMSGDATNLKQAFINIITNGCQAMNGDGTLKVYINPNGEYVEVAITDTGEGIHPDDISKIFDPFVTTKEMGIGLGLAISKRIVEDHKGSIKVKSQLSKGTTFTISLPVQF